MLNDKAKKKVTIHDKGRTFLRPYKPKKEQIHPVTEKIWMSNSQKNEYRIANEHEKKHNLH